MVREVVRKGIVLPFAALMMALGLFLAVLPSAATAQIQLTNTFNVKDFRAQLGAAQSVTTAVIGSTTYMFVAGGTDDGVSVFSVASDGTLINADNVADDATLQLDAAISVTTAVIDGTTYLFVAGFFDNGVSVFSVASDGTLTNTDNVTDDVTLQLAGAISVTTAVVGGTTYLFVAGFNDFGISVFSVSAAGLLSNIENIPDGGVLALLGASSVTTAVIGGTTYLFVTGFGDNGVSVFSVANTGMLTNVTNVTDAGSLELWGAQSATTTVIGGTTYLFVAGFNDDGISVFSVAANGSLTNTDNITDTGALELDGAYYVTTAVAGGITYLFAAGLKDNGISVFSVAANGTLTNADNVSDDAVLQLADIRSVNTATVNGTTYLFAAGKNDNGVSVFSVAGTGVLTNAFNVTDFLTNIAGANSVTTAVIGGKNYLFIVGKNDNGVSVFSVTADGALLNAYNIADINNGALAISSAFAATTAVVSGTTYLFVTGQSENGVSVFSVAADGKLTNTDNVRDGGSLELSGAANVTTAVVGVTTYLFVAGFNDDGISVFSVAANGTLTSVFNVTDAGALELQGANSVTTAVIGGTTYLFVAGTTDNGVSVFSVATNGTLTNVDNVTDAGALELQGANSVTTAVVNGTTYLFVTGFNDDGVSVFSVAGTGILTNVFNLSDTATLNLGGAASVSTEVINGITYLYVTGFNDDGISVFSVAGNGTLANVTNVSDTSGLKLDGAQSVTTASFGGTDYVFVAGFNDNGVSVFTATLLPPEIDITGLGQLIADGDNTPDNADGSEFGLAASSGETVAHSFAIHNTGNGPLNFLSNPAVQILGSNPGDFTVTKDAVTPVSAGGSTSFTVRFDPQANGLRTAFVAIFSNDANENPYSFKIQGTGINTAPTGTVVISGTTVQGQSLSTNASGIADIDGLGTFSYQWRRGGVDIAGAAGASYTLVQADAGSAVDVVVTYTDGGGTVENVTSAPTSSILGLFTLNVTSTGPGSGTLTSMPAGIDCGTDCTESYVQSTSVTLTQVAATKSTFAGWSGDCTGTGACVLTMNQNRNVSARFELANPGPTTLFSSVLPSARTGTFPGGTAITVFASVINAGGNPAQNCVIRLQGAEPVSLGYQETNAGNTLIGAPDMQFDLAAGQTRFFLLSFTPTRTSPGEEVFAGFVCDNANVDAIPGVNTVFISILDTPSPDILSIGATPSGDGVIRVASASSGFMTASAINIGSGDTPGSQDAAVIVSVDTGAAALGIVLQLCETDAASLCITPLGTGPVSTTIGATAGFFAVFVTDQSGGAGIPVDAANARVFLRFKSAAGINLSVTSAAITVSAAAADAPIVAASDLPEGRWAVTVRKTTGLRHNQQPGTLTIQPGGMAALVTGTVEIPMQFYLPDAAGTFTGIEANGAIAGQFIPRHSVFLVDAINDNSRLDIWGVYDVRGVEDVK